MPTLPNNTKGHIVRWLRYCLAWAINEGEGQNRLPLPVIISNASIETKGRRWIEENVGVTHQPSQLTRRWREMVEEDFLLDYKMQAAVHSTDGASKSWIVRAYSKPFEHAYLPYKDD